MDSADQLVDPPVVLRLVHRGSVAYMELRDSIADRGILNPILVRPSGRFPVSTTWRRPLSRDCLPGHGPVANAVLGEEFDGRRFAGHPDSGECPPARDPPTE